jgi:GH24 family phage-related lysozyme (muramidase)
MEKTLLVVLLLGTALISYGSISGYFDSGDLKACSCDTIQGMVAWAEGNKSCVYKDSLGIPTVGIGFNMKRGDARTIFANNGINYDNVLSGKTCLTPAQVTALFNNDLAWARRGAGNCIPNLLSHHQCIQNVLIDMTFNMGERSLCGWPIFTSQIQRKDYADAADNMQSTRWCGQVGRRCTRNVGLVRSC